MTRIYHTWDKWECYPAGFYENRPLDGNESADSLRLKYGEFLSDSERFRASAFRVLKEWPRSCEHYLSNERMNRLAWIGQAAACLSLGIPSIFCGGFSDLAEDQQLSANIVALDVLNTWLALRGESALTLEQAQSKTEANLY